VTQRQRACADSMSLKASVADETPWFDQNLEAQQARTPRLKQERRG
jgi:hypothetical protein